MTATHMQTPVGPMPIREGVRESLSKMADREVADAAFDGPFINPEPFAELCHRGLCFRGDMESDVYQRVALRESEEEAMLESNEGTINLGSRARDTVTGFEGVVVARTEWLHGCARITIQPTELKDGLPMESHTFDELQVETVKEREVAVSSAEQRNAGGPRDDRQALSR